MREPRKPECGVVAESPGRLIRGSLVNTRDSLHVCWQLRYESPQNVCASRRR